jgi:signal transduction histidine kinase
VISGRAELLLEEFGRREPRMAQGLGTIVAQIERISKLVAQLLDFARESRPAREPVALASVVAAVLDLLKRPLAQASIDVEMALPDDLPPIIAHANQMQQVFLNLLLNSIDAIEADPAHGNTKRRGRIAIEAESLGEDRRVRVRVRDNGHGIRPEDLDRVFDPFFTTKPVGAGTGLGLSVVYGIVVDHRGTIAVESAPEVGTVVTLTLPTEPA